MQTSEATDKIIPAFVKAQGEVGKAVKSSSNPHFKSKYADLEEVFSACRDALKSNGLAVFQTVTCDGEQMRMITRIYHESGQWIEGACPLILAKRDMQGLGSASTYARRYGLMAVMAIAPEDDDGEAASRPAPNGNGKRTPQQ